MGNAPRRRVGTFLLLAVWLVGLRTPLSAPACEWDYDTLQMERQRFPDALELITGKFLRHSPEFYQWRVRNRLQRLADEPANLALYDDLAVAYDKTGRPALAIETILKKDNLNAGMYETYANLGTFHIHAGDFQAGLPFLIKALEINPEAHFGREEYQKLLVEYVLSKRETPPVPLPMDAGDRQFQVPGGFAAFVFASKGLTWQTPADRQAIAEESSRATKGVLGMMRFGDFQSPVLLEALADLLMVEMAGDAKQLASRALLQLPTTWMTTWHVRPIAGWLLLSSRCRPIAREVRSNSH